MAKRRSNLGFDYLDRTWAKGKWYYFVRIGHGPRISVPPPGTPEFASKHAEAIARLTGTGTIGANLGAPGTVRAIVTNYLASGAFAERFKPSVQKKHRRTLERFAEKNGHRLLGQLTADDVRAMSAKIGSPYTAKLWRQAMIGFCKWAVTQKLIRQSPMTALDPIRMPKAESHRRWMPEHIKAYRDHHTSGTTKRLMLEVTLNSAARGRSDVCRMGLGNVRMRRIDGRDIQCVVFTAKKNGAEVAIPVQPALAAELSARDPNDLVFFRGVHGRPMGERQWARMFREAVKEAGLPDDLTPHGLRHAAACEAAEHEANERTIMAILGDTDPRAAATYVRQAQDQMLVVDHYARRAAAGTNQAPVTDSGSQTQSQTDGGSLGNVAVFPA